MIMRFYIFSKLIDVKSLVISNMMQIAIAFVVAGIGFYMWMFCKFFLFALVMCVIGAIVSSGEIK